MEAIICKKSSRLFLLAILLLTFSPLCHSKDGHDIIQENGFKASVAPMLTTQWSQDGGENALLPIVNGDTRADAGCGAIAMAQVMNYWEYPSHGNGYNYYVWEEGDVPQVLRADFADTYYDWGNMAAVYKDNPSVTDAQAEAIATLVYHIGVALEMKFSTSTGTQIEYISSALRKYFGYNPNMVIVRQINGAYTQDEWREMIYRELSEGRPVLMGGTEDGGANHIFVADGYDEDGNIHLNLGHANRRDEDRYYDITRTDETYTIDMRMILGLQPDEMGGEMTMVDVAAPGSLVEAMGGEMASRRVCRLKVTGTLDDSDVQWLSELTKTTTGQLSYIDLSECSIEGNSIQDNAFNLSGANYTLQEIILPDDVTEIGEKAFANCRGLVNIHLPQNLKGVGAYVFSDCRYISEINLPSSLGSIGNNPFRYSKIEKFGVNQDNQSFKMVNNALVDISGSTLYAMPVKHEGKYSVPDGVNAIGGQAFIKCCTIDALILPASLKRVGSYSFAYCYGLVDVFCHATEAPTLGGSAFYPESSSCVLHVPEGRADEYRQNGWDIFAKIVDDIKSETSGAEVVVAAKQVVGIYTIDGLPVVSPQPNRIYIYKYDDGTAERKVCRQ